VPIVKVISQSRMKKFLVRACMLATLSFMVLCASVAFSQTPPAPPRPSPTPPPRPVDGTFKNQDDTPLTTFEEEIRAKREIKLAEKDHEENLSRAREIGEIGKQLREGFKNSSTLDRDCFKKIERLEKLTKKVRSEAGGDDEELDFARPTDLPSAIKQIAEASESLSKDVQNTPRRVVSASVITHANVLLELIKIARTIARPQQP
jgi:hypothetical protein